MKYVKNGVITEMSEESKKAVEHMQAKAQINDLRDLLAKTDYKAIKYAEGFISEEEYGEIKKERQAWRERINELEALIVDE